MTRRGAVFEGKNSAPVALAGARRHNQIVALDDRNRDLRDAQIENRVGQTGCRPSRKNFGHRRSMYSMMTCVWQNFLTPNRPSGQ